MNYPQLYSFVSIGLLTGYWMVGDKARKFERVHSGWCASIQSRWLFHVNQSLAISLPTASQNATSSFYLKITKEVNEITLFHVCFYGRNKTRARVEWLLLVYTSFVGHNKCTVEGSGIVLVTDLMKFVGIGLLPRGTQHIHINSVIK